MMNADMERHIGETMAVVLRERLIDLESLEATGEATEESVGRLAFVRKLLIRFDARDTSTATRPACRDRQTPIGSRPPGARRAPERVNQYRLGGKSK